MKGLPSIKLHHQWLEFINERIQERTNYLLDCVGMLSFGHKYPHMISGGEQQRVAIARALAPNPKLMLMDEPFTCLDNRLRDEIRDLTLSLLSEEGTSVIIVTHDPEEAMKVSDSIALMREGSIVPVSYTHLTLPTSDLV